MFHNRKTGKRKWVVDLLSKDPNPDYVKFRPEVYDLYHNKGYTAEAIAHTHPDGADKYRYATDLDVHQANKYGVNYHDIILNDRTIHRYRRKKNYNTMIPRMPTIRAHFNTIDGKRTIYYYDEEVKY